MESRSVTRSNEDEEQAGNVSDSEDENELIIKDAVWSFERSVNFPKAIGRRWIRYQIPSDEIQIIITSLDSHNS